MNFKKITLDKILTVLLLLFVAAIIFSPRVKSWVIMGMMALGFFKPDIPKLGEKSMPAPQMQVQDIKGKVTDLQQLKGKVVFINFWATWCPPCLAELPSINTLYQKVKNDPDIIFLTVDIDNNLQKSTQFLQNKRYNLSVYGGSPTQVPDKLYENGIPTTLIIDKKGNIVFTHFNRANYDDDKFLQFLLGLSKQ
ncbi:MAG: TlpA family protein disulfide reductase [Sphingobacteriales bacterium]